MKIMNLDPKGNYSTIEGFEASFNDYDRAMDTVRYLGGDAVLVTENRPGYVVVRNEDRIYCLILTGNAGTDTQHYIAYSYMVNEADWDGDTYLSSKTYGTYKGASKKIYSYLH